MKTSRIPTFTTFVLFALSGLSSASVTVEYHPDGVARLGYGYEPSAPGTLFVVPCIESTGEENIDVKANGIVSQGIEIVEVKDRKALLSTVGVSASLEAYGAMYSGSTSFSQNVATSFDESSFVWTATAKTNYGRWRLKGIRPSKFLTEMKTAKDALNKCGSEIVTQESRGAIAAVVFELTNVSSTDRKDMSAALSASIKAGASGGQVDVKYTATLERVMQNSSLKTYIQVQGGPGKGLLGPILEHPSDIAVVRQSLAKYVAATTRNNAKPLTYQTTSLDKFSDLEIKAPPNLPQDRLWEIYEQYSNLTELIRRIDELVKPTSEADDFLKTFVSNDKRKELAAVRAQYDQTRTELRNAGVSCLADGANSKMPNVADLPRLNWPVIPPAPTVIGIQRCWTPELRAVG